MIRGNSEITGGDQEMIPTENIAFGEFFDSRKLEI
jgi:hypothetical protein